MLTYLMVVLKSLDKAVHEGPDKDAFVVRSPDEDDDAGGQGGYSYNGGGSGSYGGGIG